MTVSHDRILGGRLRLSQPARGHRAGTDAMLLLAAAGTGHDLVVDLGSGVGTVGLGMLALGRAQRVCLVEKDPDFAHLARCNVAANGFAERAAVVEANITARASALEKAGLLAGCADIVLANPPFNAPGQHRSSPDAQKAAAHAMPEVAFSAWAQTAARTLKANGRFILIHRPEALVWLLPMLARRFRALAIMAIHAKADEPAKRVLISGQLGSKAPARLLPALVLHEADGRFTPPGAAIHDARHQLNLGLNA